MDASIQCTEKHTVLVGHPALMVMPKAGEKN